MKFKNQLKKTISYLLAFCTISIFLGFIFRNQFGHVGELPPKNQLDKNSFEGEQSFNNAIRKIYSSKKTPINIELPDNNNNKYADLYQSCYPEELSNLVDSAIKRQPQP